MTRSIIDKMESTVNENGESLIVFDILQIMSLTEENTVSIAQRLQELRTLHRLYNE